MSDQDVFKCIDTVLATVRPNVQMDGGDVKLIKFRSGVAYVRFCGSCVGCPMATDTLKGTIEFALKQEIPDVQEVVAIEGDEEVFF